MTDLDGIPAGPIVDELGVRLKIADTDRVTEALLLAKITDLETGDVGLVMTHSGIDWIAQAGLLAAAQQVMAQSDVEQAD